MVISLKPKLKNFLALAGGFFLPNNIETVEVRKNLAELPVAKTPNNIRRPFERCLLSL